MADGAWWSLVESFSRHLPLPPPNPSHPLGSPGNYEALRRRAVACIETPRRQPPHHRLCFLIPHQPPRDAYLHLAGPSPYPHLSLAPRRSASLFLLFTVRFCFFSNSRFDGGIYFLSFSFFLAFLFFLSFFPSFYSIFFFLFCFYYSFCLYFFHYFFLSLKLYSFYLSLNFIFLSFF